MSRATRSAQTISFEWKPEVCETYWVESPGEVPVWDASRGHAPGITLFDPDGIKAAPNSGYPRLVRKSIGYKTGPGYKGLANEDVVNDIGQLASETWRAGKQRGILKNKIQRLSDKYGAPYRHEENTLDAWLSLAVRIHTELVVLHKLQLNDRETIKDQLCQRANILIRQITNKDLEIEFRNAEMVIPSKIVPLIFDVQQSQNNPALAELHTTMNLFTGTVRLDERKSFRAAAYRKIMADLNFQRFGLSIAVPGDTVLPPTVLFETQGRITIFCTPGVWIDYKMYEIWNNNLKVLECPVCSTLFVQTRSNMQYCRRGTCADKRYRQGKQTS